MKSLIKLALLASVLFSSDVFAHHEYYHEHVIRIEHDDDYLIEQKHELLNERLILERELRQIKRDEHRLRKQLNNDYRVETWYFYGN